MTRDPKLPEVPDEDLGRGGEASVDGLTGSGEEKKEEARSLLEKPTVGPRPVEPELPPSVR